MNKIIYFFEFGDKSVKYKKILLSLSSQN